MKSREREREWELAKMMVHCTNAPCYNFIKFWKNIHWYVFPHPAKAPCASSLCVASLDLAKPRSSNPMKDWLEGQGKYGGDYLMLLDLHTFDQTYLNHIYRSYIKISTLESDFFENCSRAIIDIPLMHLKHWWALQASLLLSQLASQPPSFLAATASRDQAPPPIENLQKIYGSAFSPPEPRNLSVSSMIKLLKMFGRMITTCHLKLANTDHSSPMPALGRRGVSACWSTW